MPLKAGSLFSGIGGLDLGFQRAGIDIKWQCEIDEFCQRVLEYNFGLPIYDDVKTIPDEKVKQVDFLFGGFPCQPVSNAGLRQFKLDDRWLWDYYHDLIDIGKPRWVLIENVEGLRTKGLQEVLEGLAASGYDAEWDCLPASAFGAPHQRYRYFIIAYPNGKLAGGSRSRIFDKAFTYSDRKRLQRFRDGSKLRAVEKEKSVSRFGWWAIEPAVDRMAYGVPSRVDRLRGLGNSVVPQIAEWVGINLVKLDKEIYG